MKALDRSAKHLWIFSIAYILFRWAIAVTLFVCGQALAAVAAVCLLFIGTTCVYAEGLLVLEAKSQERVAGTFQYGGAPLRFELTKDKNPKVNRGNFSLRTLNNLKIFDATFGENSTYSVQYYGGRLSITNSFPPSKRGIKSSTPVKSFKGDTNALITFVNSAEYKAIPYLSRELGRTYGVTGNVYPVSLPIYMMALSVVNKYPGEYKFEESSAGDSKSSPSSCSDLRHDGCKKDCFGMCGKECDCWQWVCGDCCCRKGCKEHDQACRDCSWYNPDPIACTRCASFDLGSPFSACNDCRVCLNRIHRQRLHRLHKSQTAEKSTAMSLKSVAAE